MPSPEVLSALSGLPAFALLMVFVIYRDRILLQFLTDSGRDWRELVQGLAARQEENQRELRAALSTLQAQLTGSVSGLAKAVEDLSRQVTRLASRQKE